MDIAPQLCTFKLRSVHEYHVHEDGLLLGENAKMKTRKIAILASMLVGFAMPPMSYAQSANLGSFLNMANQMNNAEEDNAKELRSKAGDNQALITMADTLTQDHKANQTALEALAKQKDITLDSYHANKEEQDRLDNLKGAEFNRAFLKMDVRDHKEALAAFEQAKVTFASDPDVKVYIDQTIPVLQSHLKMAENLHHDNKALGSSENPENNKSAD
jgi:predicted outer membrane protein